MGRRLGRKPKVNAVHHSQTSGGPKQHLLVKLAFNQSAPQKEGEQGKEHEKEDLMFSSESEDESSSEMISPEEEWPTSVVSLLYLVKHANKCSSCESESCVEMKVTRCWGVSNLSLLLVNSYFDFFQ